MLLPFCRSFATQFTISCGKCHKHTRAFRLCNVYGRHVWIRFSVHILIRTFSQFFFLFVGFSKLLFWLFHICALIHIHTVQNKRIANNNSSSFAFVDMLFLSHKIQTHTHIHTHTMNNNNNRFFSIFFIHSFSFSLFLFSHLFISISVVVTTLLLSYGIAWRLLYILMRWNIWFLTSLCPTSTLYFRCISFFVDFQHFIFRCSRCFFRVCHSVCSVCFCSFVRSFAHAILCR